MTDTAVTSHRVLIRPFDAGDVDGAAALLAERHLRHRLAEPLMDPAFERLDVARAAIEEALAAYRASGVVALREGTMVGYLLGQEKSKTWGDNVWVEAAGHAATEPALVRELYAAAAQAWVDEGRKNHHVLVPASDSGLVDAWFSLDFGQQHVHAIREIPGPTFGVVARSELVVRNATRDDLDALTDLERVVPEHMPLSPVFSDIPIPDWQETRNELDGDFDNPDFTWFVAEHDGRVIGSGIACALTASSSHLGPNRTSGAGFLGYAAVRPEARGLGAGRALGETILAWSRDRGFTSVVTDWRSTNLAADRTWRALGFRPAFRRLHRFIG
ncbi:MAG TPA: GNAT family N-acetyltransferase [Candidatus Limnocylindria bacterium]|nr:GNAT family N-acetyltransferase [Candidatus Limnocylindria bacterium]